MKEQVKHPTHYNKGIEMWDYAYSHNLNFFEGNIVKYLTRWRQKNGLQDLYKAKQYLDKLIELEENKDAKEDIFLATAELQKENKILAAMKKEEEMEIKRRIKIEKEK